MLDRGRRRGLVAVVAIAVVASGCFWKGKGVQPEPAPIQLEVSNRGFFDVDVYAVASSSGAGSGTRLATVSGFSTAQVTVLRRHLQPGGVLMVRVHAIGTTGSWLSPALSVLPGDRVALDVYSNADGTLSRTQFYSLPAQDPGDTTARLRRSGGG
ncbi:MAG TPA: hypothetical protein VMV51_14540 [Gemmatimonadaceae bacterium]|nr:hypothetical protein [Gemmatimonadaceae bacterium]